MTVVTGSGFRLTKNLGGRTYTLRALSFEEQGAFVESLGSTMRPSEVVIRDELREALRRTGREDLVPLVDEFEAADDSLRSVVSTYRGDLDVVEKAALKEARDRLQAAVRGLQRAEWVAREDPALGKLRGLAKQMDRREAVLLLALSLVGWEGDGLPPFPGRPLTEGDVDATLPGCDVKALAEVALKLLQPTLEQEKN